MTTDRTQTTLADIVIESPETAAVFERFQLDYCCGGGRSFADAIDEAGADAAEVNTALDAAIAAASTSNGTSPRPIPDRPAELAEYIEQVHHGYLHENLPLLAELMHKVLGVHRDAHPELSTVAAAFDALTADIVPHLMREEQVLFPLIARLQAAGASGSPALGPITVMRGEHDVTATLLQDLRTATGDFTPPSDGCASYRALFAGLEALSADLHVHLHLENNVLFPMVLRHQ